MNESKLREFRDSLMRMTSGPNKWAKEIARVQEDSEFPSELSVSEIVDHIEKHRLSSLYLGELKRKLAEWDYAQDGSWTGGTTANTPERRERIYDKLDLNSEQRISINGVIAVFLAEQPIVISERHERWYTSGFGESGVYFQDYLNYLQEKKGWKDDAVNELKARTFDVVARLANPRQDSIFQSRGLVVGYVQSGKTANFAGVIARAADAGYKLIIVLTGMTELLRQQTQRRLDREVIGKEFVDEGEYDEEELSRFVSHRGRPSSYGHFDWQRLTRLQFDYQSLMAGVSVLDFSIEKVDRAKPLYADANLNHSACRLVVMKKETKTLGKFIKDLGDKKIKSRWSEVPTLIVDDESDQASLNTISPEKATEKKARSTINGQIVKLMRLLERAQYVGYTATPFANVFIDPSIDEDLFPRDFILALPRPLGYMGAADFWDDENLEQEDLKGSNKAAYVRSIQGEDFSLGKNLFKAIDSFVLTGAIKLARNAEIAGLDFRHHTMLVHVDATTSAHKTLRDEIENLFRGTNYRSGEGLGRLKKLYDSDFLPVMKARGGGFPCPSFQKVEKHVGEAVSKIQKGSKAVLMVNSTKDADTPDFEKEGVWKIIVGGTKLSRGYTVEGLTVSYYRRRSNTTDTLMQMGRWFGFRNGYRDLVRLYISESEPVGKKGKTLDLYKAFGSSCRVEEEFRAQLQKFASLEEPRLLPRQVPPLVPQYLLPPTAKNKMFNATITYRDLSAMWTERTANLAAGYTGLENWKALQRVIADSDLQKIKVQCRLGDVKNSFDVVTAHFAPREMLSFMSEYKWKGDKKVLKDDIAFLSGSGDKDPGIDQWLLLVPQLKNDRNGTVNIGSMKLSKFERGKDGQIGAITDSGHRLFAEYCVLGRRADNKKKEELVVENREARDLFRERQAVALLYPVVEGEKVIPAFAYFYPENNIKKKIEFGALDASSPDSLFAKRR